MIILVCGFLLFDERTLQSDDHVHILPKVHIMITIACFFEFQVRSAKFVKAFRCQLVACEIEIV